MNKENQKTSELICDTIQMADRVSYPQSRYDISF